MNLLCNRFSLVLMLSLCAIGCSKSNNADPQAAPVGANDTNRFWLFPNPGRDPASGVFTTNEASYAQAYYDAIDPTDARATLNGFKITNGFGTTVAGVSEVNVIFRDVKDLGYGRKMTVRFSDPGAVSHTVAVFVENYQVVPFAGVNYSSLNLEAAITANANYHVGTNAIEYTTAPNGLKFAKFYTYAPGTGARLDTVNLDGRGQKAMPSVCINCHGGRADPLLTFNAPVPGGTTTRFPNGGYVKALMQPIDVGSVEFWSTAPYRRIDQEEALRQINYALFCTHSVATSVVVPAAGVDACRPAPTQGHDYQGAAAEMMKEWYAPAVSGINTANTAFVDSYVPAGWAGILQAPLYNGVVKSYCRVCHQLRGTENSPQDDIDFTSYAKFSSYADRIKHHVFDRGNMPLGLLIYNEFWNTGAPEQLADFLTTVNPAYNPMRVGGAATGRPVQPSGALIDPFFLAAIVSNRPDYSAYLFPFTKPTTFANIKAILQDTKKDPSFGNCVSCHIVTQVGNSYSPPIGYNDGDRDGIGGYVPAPNNTDTANDDYYFYRALRGRANLTDMLASPLLRKPTGNHHYGGTVLNVSSGLGCDGVFPNAACAPFPNYATYSQAVYDTFLDWIEHGAPYSYTGSTPNY